MRHLPTFVSVEPANYCQLHCPECPVGMARTSAKHEPKHMSMEFFEHLLQQVKHTAHTMQFYFQGEPLLNPLLPQMIQQASRAGLFTVVSTNAQLLDQGTAQALVRSGLNRIIVSIDGFSQESYAAYRVGGQLQKALDGLRYLGEARQQYRSSICIELQVLRLRSNEHEWQWIQRHYRQLGATRLVFKTAQLYDYQYGNPLMPTNERYSRYRQTADGTYVHKRSASRSALRHHRPVPCYRLWAGCVVTTAGNLLPCCYDKMGEYALGSLLQTPLKTLWHGSRAERFRRQVLCHRQHLPICQNCDQ